MECVDEDTDLEQVITRSQEAQMYAYLRKEIGGEAFRYEAIAKKVHRAAAGTAVEWEIAIVNDWLDAMNHENQLLAQREQLSVPQTPREVPFASIRLGQAGNPFYQAFLDTLEQPDLDAITSNIPYFCWMSERRAEMASSPVTPGYVRQWADKHLSNRVKAIRGIA